MTPVQDLLKSMEEAAILIDGAATLKLLGDDEKAAVRLRDGCAKLQSVASAHHLGERPWRTISAMLVAGQIFRYANAVTELNRALERVNKAA